jgi:uncharacterized protein
MSAANIKKAIVFIAFFGVLIWALNLQKNRGEEHEAVSFRESALYIRTDEGPKNIEVEVAETREQLSRGLMYRTQLPEGRGMLFLFPEELIGEMWM